MDLAACMSMLGQRIPGGFGAVACDDGSFLFEVGFDDGPVAMRIIANEAIRYHRELTQDPVNLERAIGDLASEIVDAAGMATLGVTERDVRAAIFEF